MIGWCLFFGKVTNKNACTGWFIGIRRDRGRTRGGRGGLVPVLDGSKRRPPERTSTRPPPLTASTPCPYTIRFPSQLPVAESNNYASFFY